MARILIVTSGHVSTNPRVWREADALAAVGHEVTVTGVWLDAATGEQDLALQSGRAWRLAVAADLRGGTWRSRVARTRARVRRFAGRARMRLGLGDDPHVLGYSVDRLERIARREHADLTVLHLEPALWVGERLLRDEWPVAVDIEDWYSENRPELAPDDRGLQHLARLEARVFAGARSTTTTSHAMATALAARYGMDVPGVVYNGNPQEPMLAAPDADVLRLLWLSHAVGRGRGLEALCVALKQVSGPWQLTLVGNASQEARAWITGALGHALATRVTWQPWVPPSALHALVSAHHVGLALEEPHCQNKKLTTSNKLFHYLQAGLRVVASDTAGQREVMATLPAHGGLYPAGNGAALAHALAPWLAAPHEAASARDVRYAAANACFSTAVQGRASVASAAHALAGVRR